MLYVLYDLLYAEESPFAFMRLFGYITFRAIFAAMTAFVVTLIVGPATIRLLRELKMKNTIWEHRIASEEHKIGIPTMGGILICVGFLVPVVFWCDPGSIYVWLAVSAALFFGFLGGWDDYLKLTQGNKVGLTEKKKLLGQFGFAILVAAILTYSPLSPYPTELVGSLHIPFYKHPIDFPLLRFGIIVLAIAGASNAVNLADGLDGLAIVPTIFTTGVLGIFCYVEGNAVFAPYLQLPHLPGLGEMVVVCASLVGASVGFLWFNCYPAQVFMGDLGSLALGGIIGVIAACAKQELLLVIAGGLFVAEAITSLMQRYIFVNRLGRRFFFRAPLHHDLQYRGWAEPKVVVRLWIIAAIFALLALSTLKLR